MRALLRRWLLGNPRRPFVSDLPDTSVLLKQAKALIDSRNLDDFLWKFAQAVEARTLHRLIPVLRELQLAGAVNSETIRGLLSRTNWIEESDAVAPDSDKPALMFAPDAFENFTEKIKMFIGRKGVEHIGPVELCSAHQDIRRADGWTLSDEDGFFRQPGSPSQCYDCKPGESSAKGMQ